MSIRSCHFAFCIGCETEDAVIDSTDREKCEAGNEDKRVNKARASDVVDGMVI